MPSMIQAKKKMGSKRFEDMSDDELEAIVNSGRAAPASQGPSKEEWDKVLSARPPAPVTPETQPMENWSEEDNIRQLRETGNMMINNAHKQQGNNIDAMSQKGKAMLDEANARQATYDSEKWSRRGKTAGKVAAGTAGAIGAGAAGFAVGGPVGAALAAPAGYSVGEGAVSMALGEKGLGDVAAETAMAPVNAVTSPLRAGYHGLSAVGASTPEERNDELLQAGMAGLEAVGTYAMPGTGAQIARMVGKAGKAVSGAGGKVASYMNRPALDRAVEIISKNPEMARKLSAMTEEARRSFLYDTAEKVVGANAGLSSKIGSSLGEAMDKAASVEGYNVARPSKEFVESVNQKLAKGGLAPESIVPSEKTVTQGTYKRMSPDELAIKQGEVPAHEAYVRGPLENPLKLEQKEVAALSDADLFEMKKKIYQEMSKAAYGPAAGGKSLDDLALKAAQNDIDNEIEARIKTAFEDADTERAQALSSVRDERIQFGKNKEQVEDAEKLIYGSNQESRIPRTESDAFRSGSSVGVKPGDMRYLANKLVSRTASSKESIDAGLTKYLDELPLDIQAPMRELMESTKVSQAIKGQGDWIDVVEGGFNTPGAASRAIRRLAINLRTAGLPGSKVHALINAAGENPELGTRMIYQALQPTTRSLDLLSAKKQQRNR